MPKTFVATVRNSRPGDQALGICAVLVYRAR